MVIINSCLCSFESCIKPEEGGHIIASRDYIIDLEQAGGRYNCFYTWYAIIGPATPLKVLGCQESSSSVQAFRPSGSQKNALFASPNVLLVG